MGMKVGYVDTRQSGGTRESWFSLHFDLERSRAALISGVNVRSGSAPLKKGCYCGRRQQHGITDYAKEKRHTCKRVGASGRFSTSTSKVLER